MTWDLIIVGLVLFLGGIIKWFEAMADIPRPPLARIEHCPYYGHKMILYPATGDKLVCMFCPYDMPLPRGAPQEPAQRTKWARQHSMLSGQSGRSAAFLEALERAE